MFNDSDSVKFTFDSVQLVSHQCKVLNNFFTISKKYLIKLIYFFMIRRVIFFFLHQVDLNVWFLSLKKFEIFLFLFR